MNEYDCIIVGAGFSGAVVAERLHRTGKKVLVIEKEGDIGGASRDFYNDDGVLVHEFGPHYFRTNNDAVFDYLSKFTRWQPYEPRIRSCIGGRLYPLPVNRTTLNEFFHVNLSTEAEARAFLEGKRERIGTPANAEEQVLSTMGRELYEQFFKHYTEKVWGVSPRELDPSVTGRIPVRYDTDDRYFTDKFQAMPADGYHVLFKNILHGIETWLNTDYFKVAGKLESKHIVFTGLIDEFFSNKHGALPYRSLRFEYETHDKPRYQDYVQINYPNDPVMTRIVEIKHATGQKCKNTTIMKEYPANKGPPLYPVPSQKNKQVYALYDRDARARQGLHVLGRLATYRYLNMDQVVLEALDLAKSIG